MRTKFTRHVVAVCDIHGDLPNARCVLQFSGVTDDRSDWSGNVDFFDQTANRPILFYLNRINLFNHFFVPAIIA